MSGGSLNYVFADVANACDSSDGLTHDQRELVKDVSELLHDLEWSTSGDYAPCEYKNTLEKFIQKWGDNRNYAETVKCIRCDTPVVINPRRHHGLTLTYDHEVSAVKVCEECEEIVRERDYWKWIR